MGRCHLAWSKVIGWSGALLDACQTQSGAVRPSQTRSDAIGSDRCDWVQLAVDRRANAAGCGPMRSDTIKHGKAWSSPGACLGRCASWENSPPFILLPNLSLGKSSGLQTSPNPPLRGPAALHEAIGVGWEYSDFKFWGAPSNPTLHQAIKNNYLGVPWQMVWGHNTANSKTFQLSVGAIPAKAMNTRVEGEGIMQNSGQFYPPPTGHLGC